MDISNPDRQFKTKGEVDEFLRIFLRYELSTCPVGISTDMYLENWINQLTKIIDKRTAVELNVTCYALEKFNAIFEIIINFSDSQEKLIFLEEIKNKGSG